VARTTHSDPDAEKQFTKNDTANRKLGGMLPDGYDADAANLNDEVGKKPDGKWPK
jgi:hypothetical protein